MGRRSVIALLVVASASLAHADQLGLIDMRSSGARIGECSIMDFPNTDFTPSRTGGICTVDLGADVTLLGNTIGDVSTELQGGSGDPSASCAPGEIYINRSTSLTGFERTGRAWMCSHTDTWGRFGNIYSEGIAGGQTIIGGTGADGTLTLNGTSNSDDGPIELQTNMSITDNPETVLLFDTAVGSLNSGSLYVLNISPSATMSSGFPGSLTGMFFAPTISKTGGISITFSNILTAQGSFSTSSGNLPLVRALYDTNTFTTTATSTTASEETVVANPTIAASGASGAGTLTSWNSFNSAGTISTDNASASQTVTTWRGFYMQDPTKAGGGGTETITTLVGLDIAALTSGNTNIGVRSAGSSTEMRWAGPVHLGQNAAPHSSAVLDLTQSGTATKGMRNNNVLFTNLPTCDSGALGMQLYCTDCSSTCTAGSGNGRFCGCSNQSGSAAWVPLS